MWNDAASPPLRSTTNNQFLIRAAGGIGINTNAPGAPLDVHGAVRVVRQLPGAILTLGIDRSWEFRQRGLGPGTALELASVGGGGNKNFIIHTTGRVGISTTNPGFTLHVNGSAGKPGGGSWSNASDARLKDVGQSFTRGLDALEKLQPKHYRYSPDNALDLPSDREYVEPPPSPAPPAP